MILCKAERLVVKPWTLLKKQTETSNTPSEKSGIFLFSQSLFGSSTRGAVHKSLSNSIYVRMVHLFQNPLRWDGDCHSLVRLYEWCHPVWLQSCHRGQHFSFFLGRVGGLGVGRALLFWLD